MMYKRVDVACALIFDQASENVLMVKNKKCFNLHISSKNYSWRNESIGSR